MSVLLRHNIILKYYHLYQQVSFKDPVDAKICVDNFSTNLKYCTLLDLSKVNNIDILFKNNNVKYFNEFKYFTGMHTLGSTEGKTNCIWGTLILELELPETLKRITYHSILYTKITNLIIPKNVKLITTESIIYNYDISVIDIMSKNVIIRGPYPFLQTGSHTKLQIKLFNDVYNSVYNSLRVYRNYMVNKG